MPSSPSVEIACRALFRTSGFARNAMPRPAMLSATRGLLAEIGVAPYRVAFDDFDA